MSLYLLTGRAWARCLKDHIVETQVSPNTGNPIITRILPRTLGIYGGDHWSGVKLEEYHDPCGHSTLLEH